MVLSRITLLYKVDEFKRPNHCDFPGFSIREKYYTVIYNFASVGAYCVASGGMGSPHAGSQTRQITGKLKLSRLRLGAGGNHSSALLAGGVEPGFHSKTTPSLLGFLEIPLTPF